MTYGMTTISIQFMKYQVSQIEELGRQLWPGINLSLEEVCRRLLLSATDDPRASEQRILLRDSSRASIGPDEIVAKIQTSFLNGLS